MMLFCFVLLLRQYDFTYQPNSYLFVLCFIRKNYLILGKNYLILGKNYLIKKNSLILRKLIELFQ